MKQTLTGSAAKKRNGVEVVSLQPQSLAMVCDLETNRLLEPQAVTSSKKILVLLANHAGPEPQKVLNSLMETIFEKNRRFIKLEPMSLRNIFQMYLSLERRYQSKPPVEQPALGPGTRYRGFAIVQHRVYSLNEGSPGNLFIYRRGSLLAFVLEPHHYIPLEDQDVLIFTGKRTMSLLLQSGLLKGLTRANALEDGLALIQRSNELTRKGQKPGHLLAFRFNDGFTPAEVREPVRAGEHPVLFWMFTGVLLLSLFLFCKGLV